MKKSNIIFRTIAYNAIEYYQNMIYGFFSILLSSAFFPSYDTRTSIFAGLATFALGFLAKPFGGLFFGHFGDKYGRKSTITFSIVLMSLPTFIIGVLPTYNEVGIYSSIVLIFCRLIQGFSVGGQAYSRVVFVIEHSFKEKVNFTSGLLASSGLIGAILSTVIGSLCLLDMMPGWAWRIPFLLGGLLGFVSYFIMKNVDETEEHKEAQKLNELKQNPILDVMKKYLNNFLCIICISAATLIPFYLISIYMIEYIFSSKFGFSSSQVMITITFFMLLWVILLPIMGYVADQIGEVAAMKTAALALLVFAFPLCWIIQMSASLSLTIFSFGILCALNAIYVAPSGTLMTKLFPVSVRCSGISVSSGIGSALFGGTSPLVGSVLVENTGLFSSVAVYIMIGSLIGYLALKKAHYYNKKTKAIESLNLTHSSILNEYISPLHKRKSRLSSINKNTSSIVTFLQKKSSAALNMGAVYRMTSRSALAPQESVDVYDECLYPKQVPEDSISKSFQKELPQVGKMLTQIKSFDQLTAIEIYNILKLRQDIFMIEQKINYDDIDGKDSHCVHVWCQSTTSGKLLSYLRIVPIKEKSQISIGRVLTIPHVRGQGIARQLMTSGIEFARHHYPNWLLTLSSQEHLCPFYESFGFEKKGQPFFYPEDNPAPHIPMVYNKRKKYI